MKVRVADVIVDFLIENKIKSVFGLMGGGAMFLNDALALRKKDIKTIFNHHEQASAMAAVGYSKYTNNSSAAIFTTGCGSTNSITGVLDAWQDNLPSFFISGQVKRKETSRNKKDIKLRNFGVQEADVISIVENITKYSVMINDPESIYEELNKAFKIAKSGCPGPVWIDVPLDVQSSLVKKKKWTFNLDKTLVSKKKLNKFTNKILNLLNKSERPVIIAGNGIRLSSTIKEFNLLIKKFKIPVVSSYLGIDIFPNSSKLHYGTLGTKGNRLANFVIQNSDLVISMGCRLSVPLTGFQYETFAREAKICVIDINSDEHKKNTVKIDHFLKLDLKHLIPDLTSCNLNRNFKKWTDICNKWKKLWPTIEDNHDDKDGINLYSFMHILNKNLRDRCSVVADAGSAGYVSAQSLKIKSNKQRFIMPGAQMEMGFSIPCAIGVAEANKKDIVYAITGDGSFQLNIQELQTISHYKYNIKLFIWNNSGYLSIKSTQSRFFKGRDIGAGPKSGLTFPEIKKIAEAYKIKYKKISTKKQLNSILQKHKVQDGPEIIEVICPEIQEIIPTAATKTLDDGSLVSSPLEDMYPFMEDKLFKENMIVKPIDLFKS